MARHRRALNKVVPIKTARIDRRRRNGAVNANVPASTEDIPLTEIISYQNIGIFLSDISADTFTGPCSDVSYMATLIITELNWILIPCR